MTSMPSIDMALHETEEWAAMTSPMDQSVSGFDDGAASSATEEDYYSSADTSSGGRGQLLHWDRTRHPRRLVAVPESAPADPRYFRGRLVRWPGIILMAGAAITAIALITSASISARNAMEARTDDANHRFKIGGKGPSVVPVPDGPDGSHNPDAYPARCTPFKEPPLGPNPPLLMVACAMPNYVSKNGRLFAEGPNGASVALGIKGINWSGMETSAAIPFGLWANSVNGTTLFEIATFLAANRFNSVRLPLSIAHILANQRPTTSFVNTHENKALNLTSYLATIGSIVTALAFRNISVLLDLHTLSPTNTGALAWTTPADQAAFLRAVDTLTGAFCSPAYWNVLGIDVKNEPYAATWGDNSATDFRLHAQTIGDRMLAACPTWVAFVGGISLPRRLTIDGREYNFSDWWGGGLQEAAAAPVQLALPHKLVYSPHYYSPAVYPQLYFLKSGTLQGDLILGFTELDDASLRARVHTTAEYMFGYLRSTQGSAVILGEFGGLYTQDAHPMKTTQRVTKFLIDEMKQPGYGGGYLWALNPESAYQYNPSDTHVTLAEGLLTTNWLRANEPFVEAMTGMDSHGRYDITRKQIYIGFGTYIININKHAVVGLPSTIGLPVTSVHSIDTEARTFVKNTSTDRASLSRFCGRHSGLVSVDQLLISGGESRLLNVFDVDANAPCTQFRPPTTVPLRRWHCIPLSQETNRLTDSVTLAQHLWSATFRMSVRVPPVGTKPVRKQPLRLASYSDVNDGNGDMDEHGSNPAMCSLVDKREVCAQVLRQGLVQSFVDLFYLVHRVDTTLAPDGHEKKEPVAISPAQMKFLRDNLTTAEKARRQGDVIQVFESYERLAVHFMGLQDLRTGVFFYEKCLEIARLSRNQDFELAALENLGNAYYGLKEYHKAKENHENHLALVKVLRGGGGDQATATAELSKVYEQVALTHEAKAEYDLAIGIHVKFLQCAQEAQDVANVAAGHYRIGVCYNAMDQATDALVYLKDYLVMCKNMSDIEGECKAYAALATTFEALGHSQQAMEYLKEYLITAEKIENIVAQAEACRRLGLLYSASREFGLATEMMERNFDLIKNAAKNDTRLLDQARISLGVIRAHQKFGTFVEFVTSDVHGFLNWKASRTIEPKTQQA
ncbi:Aste57867_4529 [Aphanomyces stellatus]|uniref:Aste57867_4529 protein n=1 Tax=Aphanomyces stellatus TaxID=120398 RepID=A0A485KFK4_9STRA|nr:hypothetical protein As57867_004516 [Aphanomyces stellatus]VFT81639.1 Aste57867_4529 [Aphanomyces stellatus]